MTVFALLAAIGQLAVSVVAPLGEARAGQSAPSHVEEQGVAKHYAHNEATCVACVAGTHHSLPLIARTPLVEIVRHVAPIGAPEHTAPHRALHETSPRAPPSLS